MTDTIIDTNVLPDSTGGHPNGQVGTTHSSASGDGVRNAVRSILGDRVRLSEMMSLGNLDYHTGYAHTTTSLPYAIHGTATVVSRKVATQIAAFQDPIKSVLGVAIHRDRKVIIKRRYVVGGQTLITPERAPARTVAIKEDAREVILTRYGGDLEMNLNLFLQPEKAAEELEMKVSAQREALEQTLVDIGYETIMNEGTSLMRALQRANPATATMNPKERVMAAERIYIQSIFGCMAKNPFPAQNLLAACAKANMYTPAGGAQKPYTVMIVPPGMDLHKYTRPDEMVFSVSGLSANDHGTIDMPLKGVLKDNVSNLKIMQYVPPASARVNGAANPQVETSGLAENVGWATYYPLGKKVTKDSGDAAKSRSSGLSNFDTSVGGDKDGSFYYDGIRIVDFKTRSWKIMEINSTTEELKSYAGFPGYSDYLNVDDGIVTMTDKALKDDCEMILVRPQMMAAMSSAIVATRPGSETGELLMAYPQTGVSTNQSTETMKMQLRMYLGCAIYEPENLLICPDVQFEGLIAGHGSKICTEPHFDPETSDLIVAFKKKGSDLNDIFSDPYFAATAGKCFYKEYFDMKDEGDLEGQFEPNADNRQMNGFKSEDGVPLSVYVGTTESYTDGHWHRATENAGHLGHLDDPRECDRCDGIQVMTTPL